MNQFVMRRLISALCATSMLAISSQAMAAAFQLWEQDGASLGNYHAGYAAIAEDASTAWYNPAGITRFKNQQLVYGAVGVMSDFTYRGSVTVSNIVPPFVPSFLSTRTFNNVTAQGGQFSVVPDFHYVAPITDRLGFGFSVTAPFGLKTSYGNSTPVRFASAFTSITIIDISPSLGFRVTDKGSIGAGFDVQKGYAEFNTDALATLVSRGPNLVTAQVNNKANDTGYGYHLGALYEFTPCTRVGLSYHSQVVHHFSGHSTLEGDIAQLLHGSTLSSPRATTKVTLPPYTAASIYNRLNPQLAVMASAIYTQWDTFKTLTLNGVAGAIPVPVFPFSMPSTSIQAVIPEFYRNSWTLSAGADYYLREGVILRGGLGWDQTPVTNTYRNLALPDKDRYVIGVGGHFQATRAVGFDVGYMHVFFQQAHVNPPAQVTGAQVVTTPGHVTGGADLLSGQITWDLV